MFLRSLFKLNNSISLRNFRTLPPNSDADQTGSISIRNFGSLTPNSGEDLNKNRSSPYSSYVSVRNFGFLVAKWVSLAKKPRDETYFAPFSILPEGAPPPRLPEIDASVSSDSKLVMEQLGFGPILPKTMRVLELKPLSKLNWELKEVY